MARIIEGGVGQGPWGDRGDLGIGGSGQY